MCAVPTGSSVRGWGLTSRGRGPAAGERARRAFMLTTLSGFTGRSSSGSRARRQRPPSPRTWTSTRFRSPWPPRTREGPAPPGPRQRLAGREHAGGRVLVADERALLSASLEHRDRPGDGGVLSSPLFPPAQDLRHDTGDDGQFWGHAPPPRGGNRLRVVSLGPPARSVNSSFSGEPGLPVKVSKGEHRWRTTRPERATTRTCVASPAIPTTGTPWLKGGG